MKAHVVLSIDGKLISDPDFLQNFDIREMPCTSFDIEKLNELVVTILPVIAGHKATITITGKPGGFLKIPITFSMIGKQVNKGICTLLYKRREVL